MITRRILKSTLLRTLTIGVLVGLAVVGVRQLRGLQWLELAAYDRFMAWGHDPFVDNERITIVEITEEDIRAEYPQSDDTLADILKLLIQHRPRAIGIDIYREKRRPRVENAIEARLAEIQRALVDIKRALEVETADGKGERRGGRPKLSSLLSPLDRLYKENDNIVNVMLFGIDGGNDVRPPPFLDKGKDSPQVGFANVLKDSDQMLRKGMLALDRGGTSQLAFGYRLAKLYLQKEEGVDTDSVWSEDHLKLGAMTLPRFRPHDGGYVGDDARGFQFLLDYKDGQFRFIKKRDLLASEFDPDLVEDRIVLIGQTAASLGDVFVTPVSDVAGRGGVTQGVEIHARITSQLLRLALGETDAIVIVSEPVEWSWILLLAAAGAVAGGRWRSPGRVALGSVGGSLLLMLIGYLGFRWGWWLPAPPLVIGFVAAAGLGAVAKRASEVRVFLSYAREDVDKVRDLREKLRREGYVTWMDIWDIPASSQWENEIRKGVHRSDFFLACLSMNSVGKEGIIQKEISEAVAIWTHDKLDGDAYLIPVRLEECPLPESLSRFQWVSLHLEDGWERLRDAIEKTVAKRGVMGAWV